MNVSFQWDIGNAYLSNNGRTKSTIKAYETIVSNHISSCGQRRARAKSRGLCTAFYYFGRNSNQTCSLDVSYVKVNRWYGQCNLNHIQLPRQTLPAYDLKICIHPGEERSALTYRTLKRIQRLIALWARKNHSVTKGICKIVPPGALPMTTLPIPLYIPLRPPALKKPCADCKRVFIVSNG